MDGARLGQMAEHLADEERVALRLLVDGPGQLQVFVVQGVPRRLLHEGDHP